MTVIERLREKANSLPASPGVYIMKNAEGEVIYVGKSKKLKNRVSSYFVGSSHSYKTERMVSLVRDFDFILCDSEIEALTLENVLIKKHTPRYNVRLKDAKSYPYIKVTAEEYPRLLVTRERRSDKGRYFGPYRGSSEAYTALDTVKRIFRIPSCKRSFPKDIGKDRPCLYKGMGRCSAPCDGSIGAEEYRSLVSAAVGVLGGNVKATKELLTAEMMNASRDMEFERAGALRDSIRALDALSEKQKVVADDRVERDVFALFVGDVESVLAMLSIRGGKLINKNEFVLCSARTVGAEDAVSLIADIYDSTGNVPREIMLDFLPTEDDRELLSEYLTILASRKVAVRIPERGEGRALCDMALENAKETARQRALEGQRENKSLSRLCELLSLEKMPARIEAYDVSNFGKDNITASMVVWRDGGMKRSHYRSFSIKTLHAPDDYASIREALERRLSHIGDGSASFGEEPGLILIDGGAGQVNVALEVLRERGLSIPAFGMVKDDFHKTRALTDGEREISIALEMGVYNFIYGIQEEAHRFAVKNTTKGKIKTLTRSSLEDISGIGQAKAKALLQAMKLSQIKLATEEELAKIKGISAADARRIREHFDEKAGGVSRKTKKGRE